MSFHERQQTREYHSDLRGRTRHHRSSQPWTLAEIIYGVAIIGFLLLGVAAILWQRAGGGPIG